MGAIDVYLLFVRIYNRRKFKVSSDIRATGDLEKKGGNL